MLYENVSVWESWWYWICIHFLRMQFYKIWYLNITQLCLNVFLNGVLQFMKLNKFFMSFYWKVTVLFNILRKNNLRVKIKVLNWLCHFKIYAVYNVAGSCKKFYVLQNFEYTLFFIIRNNLKFIQLLNLLKQSNEFLR